MKVGGVAVISHNGANSGQRIVVGVDGSPSSKAALAWAIGQAELTGATVEAVIAWHYPAMVSRTGLALMSAQDDADLETFFGTDLSDAIEATVTPGCQVKISATVRKGNAAQVLLDCAEGASLLVVGSRGRGGFASALLGSVSQHCAQHAPCPIVIYRDSPT
jgi:nucleotide-binding universal stress UspA family protein